MTRIPDDGSAPPSVLHNASPRSFARNVIFGYLATLTSLLSGIVVTPVLYRTLGIDRFAAFGLVTGITGLALLADLGVGTSTVRRVAGAVAVGDDRSMWATLRASRVLLGGSAVLSFCALALVAWRLPELFSLPSRLGRQAQLGLLIAAVGQSTAIAMGTPTAVIIGHGRADLLAKRGLGLGLLTAAVQCVVALLGGGLVGVCTVLAVSSIATAGIGLLLQRRVVGPQHDHVAPRSGELRDILSEGAANFVISVAGTVAFLADTIVLGAIAPLAAIAAYNVAAKFPALIRIFSGKAIDLLQPTFSHLHAAGDADRDQTLFFTLARSTKFSIAAAATLGIGVCCCSGLLLSAWVGPTPPHTQTVLYLLMAATVLQMSGHAIYVMLTGIRRLRRLLVFSLVSAATNIGLSIWFTHHLDARGPALASLICVGVGDLVVLPMMVASSLDIAPARVIRELTLAPLLPAVPAILIFLILDVSTRSYWALLVSFGCAATYLLLFWLFLGTADRVFARGLLARAFRHRRGRPVDDVGVAGAT